MSETASVFGELSLHDFGEPIRRWYMANQIVRRLRRDRGDVCIPGGRHGIAEIRENPLTARSDEVRWLADQVLELQERLDTRARDLGELTQTTLDKTKELEQQIAVLEGELRRTIEIANRPHAEREEFIATEDEVLVLGPGTLNRWRRLVGD